MTLLDSFIEDGTDLRHSKRLYSPTFRAKSAPLQTAAPISDCASDTALTIPIEYVTHALDCTGLAVRDVLTAVAWPELVANLSSADFLPELFEEDIESGAPSVALLLAAFRESRTWLLINQDQLCSYLGFSPSTVMAWKGRRAFHPRHSQIPVLLRLWAAVSGAYAEFGAEGLHHLIGPHRTAEGGFDLPANDLSTLLLDAADRAGIDALMNDGFTSETAVPLTLEELEAGERELSQQLNRHLEGPGNTDRR